MRGSATSRSRHEALSCTTLNTLSTRRDAKIDNEVGPSTVRTWLTCWQRNNTLRNDHLRRGDGRPTNEDTVRDWYLGPQTHPSSATRPCKELQSYPSTRSNRQRLLTCRGPPAAAGPEQSECHFVLDGELRKVYVRCHFCGDGDLETGIAGLRFEPACFQNP